jgi:hypothetical protein
MLTIYPSKLGEKNRLMNCNLVEKGLDLTPVIPVFTTAING